MKTSALPAKNRGDASNDRIGGEISSRLAEARHHELKRVEVHVNNDAIVLRGIVSCFYIKQLAQETARLACQQRKIRNEILVRDTGRSAGC